MSANIKKRAKNNKNILDVITPFSVIRRAGHRISPVIKLLNIIVKHTHV